METILPPLVGKHNQFNRSDRKKISKKSEISSEDAVEDLKIRKSERLNKANSVTPMGGVKYIKS